ncbi:DUF4254 domain-containing protein [Salidesulfovibrio onnuriiensis]|uniref:DUF4254 domain-containing protein n=1 Tax=Salidesulfovibrio onnuriiensis TaxID=2583823 RepID=UPI0011C8488A|nr:DUF4254 domain-containing protein [Salidesulfovibrio onnuriiensis]
MAEITIDDIKETLADCVNHQVRSVTDWHFGEPVYENPDECPALEGIAGLRELSARLHWVNFRMWHLEDRARRRDVPEKVIAECKYAYDKLNTVRNGLAEAIDVCLLGMVCPLLPESAEDRYNTETVGCVLDRLSVMALRVFHMREQARRKDAGEDHTNTCSDLCEEVQARHDRLVRSLMELIDEYAEGRKKPEVHQYFKMYNDPEMNPELYKNK